MNYEQPIQEYPRRRSPIDEIPPPQGAPTKAGFHGLINCMDIMNTFTVPADRVLSNVFRQMRSLTSRDRAKIADVSFAWLRAYATFGERFPTSTMRRWGIAALHVHGGISREAACYWGNSGDAKWLDERMTATEREFTPAQKHECPQWLWDRLIAQSAYPQASALMKALNFPAPFDLRVNTLKAKRDDVLRQFAAEAIDAEATTMSAYGIRLRRPMPLAKHDLFTSGAVEVQDEGSQLLAQLVGAKRGEMVADFCAGAGGKTLAIGAMMTNTGRLYAFDVDEGRLKKLGPRMSRAGLSNVQPMHLDTENDSRLRKLVGKMDRVLVDAPCSGLGTLRRNPDLKWRQSEQSVAEMNAKQLNILIAAARLVKDGGRLVYGTCSILREENEAIVEAFLKRGGFKLIPAAQILQAQGITGDYLQLSPVTHGCDGFFAAALERIA